MFCLQMHQWDAEAATAASVTTPAPCANPRRVARKFAINSKRRKKNLPFQRKQKCCGRFAPAAFFWTAPLPSAASTSVKVGELGTQEMARHRRSLVGHSPGVLMKCGTVHKRASPDGAWETPPARSLPERRPAGWSYTIFSVPNRRY